MLEHCTLQRIGERPPEFAELFDYVESVLVWTKDAGRRFQWANLPLALNLGMHSQAQLIGRTDLDFCSPLLTPQYRRDDEQVLDGERVIARIELIDRFDHTARWFATSKIPVRNEEGRIVGTAGVAYPLGGPQVCSGDDRPVARAVRFIAEHYAESIGNREIATACGLSVRTLERRFRAAYKLSPHDYLRQLRVRFSCGLLVHSNKSMKRIARELGFTDQSHFAREFRYLLGVNPSVYRDTHTTQRRGATSFAGSREGSWPLRPRPLR